MENATEFVYLSLGESETDLSNMSVNEQPNVTLSSNPNSSLYQVPYSAIILLSVLYGSISIAALVGNVIVLGIIFTSRHMRTVTNFFIANLAVADIIIGIFTIPFQFQAALLQRWDLPHFLCAFCPFIQVLTVTVSVFTLSAIAVDRYQAVMHPLSPKSSKRNAGWLILAIWMISVLLAIPAEFDYNVIWIEDGPGKVKAFCANTWLSASFRTYYNQSVVILQYFFPLFIISGAYIRMGAELWRAQPPGNREETRDAVVLRNKIKVIKMLALVVIMFGFCWFPLQTYNFLQTAFPSINSFQYINVVWFCSHWLAMSNSCVNPFIYAIYNEKFKVEFRRRLRCGNDKTRPMSTSLTMQRLERTQSKFY